MGEHLGAQGIDYDVWIGKRDIGHLRAKMI